MFQLARQQVASDASDPTFSLYDIKKLWAHCATLDEAKKKKSYKVTTVSPPLLCYYLILSQRPREHMPPDLSMWHLTGKVSLFYLPHASSALHGSQGQPGSPCCGSPQFISVKSEDEYKATESLPMGVSRTHSLKRWLLSWDCLS